MWAERASYGHFFYRIANGESAADAYDRISGFNESLWRQFGEEECASVVVLVTHGLMARVFLMKWYHYSVEYFEDLRNVDHCEFVVMNKEAGTERYVLQNQLRTWSQLKRERKRAWKRELGKDEDEEEDDEEDGEEDVPMKMWGGCVEGCQHGREWDAASKRQKVGEAGGVGVGRVAMVAEAGGPGRRLIKAQLRFHPGRDAGGSDSGVSSEAEDGARTEEAAEKVMTIQTKKALPHDARAAEDKDEQGGDHNATGAKADALGDAQRAEDA